MGKKYNAIGVIETFGLIPSIVFGDAIVDYTDCVVIGYEHAGEESRIWSCKFYGTESSVRAAFDIGGPEAAKSGKILSMSLIGAPDEETAEYMELGGNVVVDDEEMINDLLRRAGFID